MENSSLSATRVSSPVGTWSMVNLSLIKAPKLILNSKNMRFTLGKKRT